jgi:hypothetical protein
MERIMAVFWSKRYYGSFSALFLICFCIESWSVEAELLLERNEEDARHFKQAQIEDCNMTAAAVLTMIPP